MPRASCVWLGPEIVSEAIAVFDVPSVTAF
jgi:hypothetical protein